MNFTFKDVLYLIAFLGTIFVFYFANNKIVYTEIADLKSEVRELRKDIKRFQAPVLLEKIDDNTYRIIILEEANKK